MDNSIILLPKFLGGLRPAEALLASQEETCSIELVWCIIAVYCNCTIRSCYLLLYVVLHNMWSCGILIISA